MGTSTSEKWDMAASSKMTLSIQLISDSGEPIVDSVITGSGTEPRDQMSQLFIGKLPTGILLGTDVDAPQQPQYSSEGKGALSVGRVILPRTTSSVERMPALSVGNVQNR